MFNTNIVTYKKLSGVLIVLVFVAFVQRYSIVNEKRNSRLPIPLADVKGNDIQVSTSRNPKLLENLLESKSRCELPTFETKAQCEQINKQGGPCFYMCQCYYYKIVLPGKYPKPLLLPKEDMLNIEAITLHDQNLLNITDLPSVELSKLLFLNPNQKLFVGDKFKVVIQVLDRAGRPRRVGGDDVRIWMVSADKHSGLKVVGDVVDYSNGTYVATITAIWEGRSVIYAKIEHSREKIATRLRWKRQYRNVYHHGGIFTKFGVREETVCSFFSLKTEACNFTMLNGGLPWYCEKPTNPKLKCEDINRFDQLGYQPIPLTNIEKELTQNRKLNHTLIKTKLTVDIGKGAVSHPQENCNKLKRSKTWDTRIPTGYMNGSHWISLTCKNTLNIASLRSCLNNTKVILSGDSTTRQYYTYLNSKIVPDCNPVTKPWTTQQWHEPSKCVSKTRNLTIIWNPHELPFSNANREGNITNIKSTLKMLNEIKSNENVIFVIHYYAHLIRAHYTALIYRLRILKDSINSVLLRNKNVKILIKSPYAFDVSVCRRQLTDLNGRIYVEIIKRELREFQDLIVYMNVWEMSVAMENTELHPSDSVVWDHIKMIFGYICE